MQGGDITHHDGTGGRSIYGERFADEGELFSHSEAGLLSMANTGRDSNGSQFFITLASVTELDRKHVVFGRVVKGFEFLKRCERVRLSPEHKPLEEVKIVECGELDS